MRPVSLLRIAAEAEGVRLRKQVSRTSVRVVLGILALVFLTATLVFVHVTGWYLLRLAAGWTQYYAAGAIALGDLVFAVVLGLMAARSSPSHVEVEAREVRQRALASIGTSVALTTALVPAMRVLTSMLRRRR